VIEKGKPLKLFSSEEEWHPLSPQEFFRIAEALSDPIRQWVYTVLGEGPLRQAELARRASKHFNRKITNILMSYHLKRLESAGLIRFETDLLGRAKKVYRSMELRLEGRELEGEVPRAELNEELSRALMEIRNPVPPRAVKAKAGAPQTGREG